MMMINKIKDFFLVAFFLPLTISCLGKETKSNPKPENAEVSVAVDTFTLKQLQGVWENVERLDNRSNYVIFDNSKSLGISLESNTLLALSVGFLQSEQKNYYPDSIKFEDIKAEGQYYVWLFEEDAIPERVLQRGDFHINHAFFTDGQYMNSGANQNSDYEKLRYLPYYVYKLVKEWSQNQKRNYVEEFHLPKFLRKTIVKVDKTYFHNEPKEDTKRKAFIIKGDEVIIDEIKNGWYKVAYEGEKVTTEGWIKAGDLVISE